MSNALNIVVLLVPTRANTNTPTVLCTRTSTSTHTTRTVIMLSYCNPEASYEYGFSTAVLKLADGRKAVQIFSKASFGAAPMLWSIMSQVSSVMGK